MRKNRTGTERPQGATGRGGLCGEGGRPPPPEENAGLLYFTPDRVQMLLREVYGEFPHHNDGLYLDGGVADDAIWQCRWHQIAAHSDSWYITPSGAVGRRFTALLAVEWQGVLGTSWNSEKTLVFAHVVLTKTLGVCRAKEIQAWITRRMDLWERGLHASLVVDNDSEGTAREGRTSSGGRRMMRL